MNRRDYLRLTGALGVSAGIAGCGSQNNSGGTPTGTSTTQATTQAQQTTSGQSTPSNQSDMGLIERAKQEGTVTIYSVMDQPDMEKIFDPAFKKDYPWAKFNVLGLGPSDIASKMSSEYTAKKVQADVAINTQGTMAPLIQNGVFSKISDQEDVMDEIHLMNYSDAAYDDWWAPADTIPQIIMYNSNKTTSPPETYEALADPKWKGELVMDSPSILNVSGGVFATLYGVWGETKWTKVMKGIAANNPRFTQSGSDTFRVLSQGEASVGIGLLADVLGQSGTELVKPVWAKPVSYLNAPSYIAANAPHPNMAALYVRWLLSVSGQEAMAQSGRFPPLPPVAAFSFHGVPSDVQLVPTAYKTPTYFTQPDQWSSRLKNIFGA